MNKKKYSLNGLEKADYQRSHYPPVLINKTKSRSVKIKVTTITNHERSLTNTLQKHTYYMYTPHVKQFPQEQDAQLELSGRSTLHDPA